MSRSSAQVLPSTLAGSLTIFPTATARRESIGRVTDGELVERARGGDAAAFGELAVRHGPAVYRAAVAALGSPADAEDVAQEALVLAFRRLGQFREEASFRTWVVSIAWRRALSRRRSIVRRLKQLAGSIDEFGLEPAACVPSAEQALIAGELGRDVRRLIRALPVRLRDPFLLAATGEQTYEELALVLGIPVGTLKWRISEARRILRGKLTTLGHSR